MLGSEGLDRADVLGIGARGDRELLARQVVPLCRNGEAELGGRPKRLRARVVTHDHGHLDVLVARHGTHCASALERCSLTARDGDASIWRSHRMLLIV